MSLQQEVIATAEDLQQATRRVLSTPDTRTIQEKNTDWLQWFEKRAVRLFKDATQLGRMNLTIDVPYQPDTIDNEKGLVDLRKRLRPFIPGCAIHFIEEVYEDNTYCTILIDWSP